jgi:hypothetical protein
MGSQEGCQQEPEFYPIVGLWHPDGLTRCRLLREAQAKEPKAY